MPHLSLSMFRAADRLIHWGPFLALFIIIYVSVVSINAMLQLWPPAESLGGLLHLCLYLLQFYLVMSNYLTACFMGPGFVPIGWRPVSSFPSFLLLFLLSGLVESQWAAGGKRARLKVIMAAFRHIRRTELAVMGGRELSSGCEGSRR